MTNDNQEGKVPSWALEAAREIAKQAGDAARLYGWDFAVGLAEERWAQIIAAHCPASNEQKLREALVRYDRMIKATIEHAEQEGEIITEYWRDAVALAQAALAGEDKEKEEDHAGND